MIILSASETSACCEPRPERPTAPIGPYMPGAIADRPAPAPLRSPAAGPALSSPLAAALAHQPPGRPTGPPKLPAEGLVSAALTSDPPPA